MKLITGASGALGSKILKQLLTTENPATLAALVRDESKATDLIAAGVQIRKGDYFDSKSLENAFEGVTQLVLISSNDFNDRFGQHQRVIDAAVKTGVQHIYYTGVSMRSIDESPLRPFLEDHYLTEEYIKASGLTYTFLQHTLYAEVIPMFLGPQVVESGVFFPAGEGRVTYATREDLAEAIATILRSSGHEYKTYRMTNSSSWSYASIAEILSELHGKKVGYVSPTPEEFEAVLQNLGLPESIIQMSLGFAAGIAHHDFEDSYEDLTQILGRKPTDLKEFLKSVYAL